MCACVVGLRTRARVRVCVCVRVCERVHARALTSPPTPFAPAHRTHPPTHACKHCSFTGAASPPSSPSPPPPAFAVATAHDAACDAEWASRGAVAASTLVLFMGARRLGAVAAALREGGWEEATPLAVVQWAHTTRQRVFVSTVGRCACVRVCVRAYAYMNACVLRLRTFSRRAHTHAHAHMLPRTCAGNPRCAAGELDVHQPLSPAIIVVGDAVAMADDAAAARAAAAAAAAAADLGEAT